MRLRLLPLAAVTFLGLVSSNCALTAESSWLTLGKLPQHEFTAFTREGTCVWGRFARVDSESASMVRLTVRGVKPPAAVVVQRRNIIRVSDVSGPDDVVFSGRSSWADVEAVGHRAGLTLSVLEKSGDRVLGRATRVEDRGLALQQQAAVLMIPKEQIREVSIIRLKPGSPEETAPWIIQEASWAAILFPQTWEYWLHIRFHLDVRLYDSALDEDDSPVSCSNSYRGS